MASRIRENGIKALIYLLLFAVMMFKTLFSDNIGEQRGGSRKVELVSMPSKLK